MLDWTKLRETATDVGAEPPRIDPKRPLGHLSDAELQTFLETARRRKAQLQRQFDEVYERLLQL